MFWVMGWVLQPGTTETRSEQEGRQNFKELLDLSSNCRPLGFFREGRAQAEAHERVAAEAKKRVERDAAEARERQIQSQRRGKHEKKS
ncbi:hypothetical protein K1719_040140 [Acacia pycnantha]|nr:hypothetical protein K1719_040140 [Acacia pycnantha]